MRRRAVVSAFSAGLMTCLVSVQLAAQQDSPPRVRGTIEQVNGRSLTVKTRSGGSNTFQIKDGAPVVAVVPGSMADIQSNTFVGITATAQPDGSIKAVEVHVFPEAMRGTGEGHYGWDLMPNSTMTNAAVTQQVKKVEGNALTLKYKEGEKTIVVPTEATIVNLAPGDQGDLKVGAKVFVPRWEKQPDGSWQAAVIVAGRDGLTPPM
jgi:hypothetical protein